MKRRWFFSKKSILFVALSAVVMTLSLFLPFFSQNSQYSETKITHSVIKQTVLDGEYVDQFDRVTFSNVEINVSQIHVELTDEQDNKLSAVVLPTTSQNVFDINVKLPYYSIQQSLVKKNIFEKITLTGDTSISFDNEIEINVTENKINIVGNFDFINTNGYINDYIEEFGIFSAENSIENLENWNFEFRAPQNPELNKFFKIKTFIKNSKNESMAMINLGFFEESVNQKISIFGNIIATNELHQLMYSGPLTQVLFNKKQSAPTVTAFDFKNTTIKDLQNEIINCFEVFFDDVIDLDKLSISILDRNDKKIPELNARIKNGTSVLSINVDLLVYGFIQKSLDVKFEISWATVDQDVIALKTSDLIQFQHIDNSKPMSTVLPNINNITGNIEADIDGVISTAASIRTINKGANDKVTVKVVDINDAPIKQWVVVPADVSNNIINVSLYCLTEDALTTKGRIQAYINEEFAHQTQILTFNRQYKETKVVFENIKNVSGSTGERFSSIGHVYVDQQRAGRDWYIQIEDQHGNKVSGMNVFLQAQNEENWFNVSLKTDNGNSINDSMVLAFHKNPTTSVAVLSPKILVQLKATPWIKITNVKNYYSFEEYKNNNNFYKHAFDFEISEYFDASEFISNLAICDKNYEDTLKFGPIAVRECHLDPQTGKGDISLTNFSLQDHSVIRSLQLVANYKNKKYGSEFNDFTIMNEIIFNSSQREYSLPSGQSIESFGSAIVYDKDELSIHFMDSKDGHEITSGIIFSLEKYGSMRRISVNSEGNKHGDWTTLVGYIEVRSGKEIICRSPELVKFNKCDATVTFLSDTDGSELNDFAASGPLQNILKIRVTYAPEESLVLSFIDKATGRSVRWWSTYGTIVKKIDDITIEVQYFFQLADNKSSAVHHGHFEISAYGSSPTASHNRGIHIYFFNLDKTFKYIPQENRPRTKWMINVNKTWDFSGYDAQMYMDFLFEGRFFFTGTEYQVTETPEDIFFADFAYDKYFDRPSSDFFFRAKWIDLKTGHEAYHPGIKPVLEHHKSGVYKDMVSVTIQSVYFAENVLTSQIMSDKDGRRTCFAPIKIEMYFKGSLLGETDYHKYWEETSGYSFKDVIDWMPRGFAPGRDKSVWC